MVTTFWDLCSDLILEICKYFSTNELYYSLYPDCLPHLFELLETSHTRLHVDVPNDDLLTGILFSLIDTNQISSLRLSSTIIPRMTFNSVRALTLHNVEDIEHATSEQLVLPALERLTLTGSDPLRSIDLIHIFAQPSLKYLKIESPSAYIRTASIPHRRFCSIEKFVLNASCSPDSLQFFLLSLPNLHTLRVRTLINTLPTTRLIRAHIIPPPIIQHSSLLILDLIWYHPTMSDINSVLTGLSNLKHCRLNGVMHFEELNGQLWHQLLTQTCANLLKMYVNMLIWTGDQADEIKMNFDLDTFFHSLDFEFLPSKREEQLFVFFGSFQRCIE